jgi:hypothetical protein
VGVYLHHDQGQGDSDGRIKPTGEPDDPYQDDGKRKAIGAVLAHLGALRVDAGTDPRRGNQVDAVDPSILYDSFDGTTNFHHGFAFTVVLNDDRGPVAGFGADGEMNTGLVRPHTVVAFAHRRRLHSPLASRYYSS